jgi:hypothetical protein
VWRGKLLDLAVIFAVSALPFQLCRFIYIASQTLFAQGSLGDRLTC